MGSNDHDPDPSLRTVERRDAHCIVCKRKMRTKMATTPNPEAPEMISIPPSAWFGLVAPAPDDEDQTAMIIFTCSDECRDKLLSH